MTIYLYVKTHRKTGLKYLGKTERNPYKYKGSGHYWSRHLKKHGNDVDTIILRECASNDEIKEWGLYYSNLWNVVESDEWANEKPEEGDGFGSEELRLKWQDIEYRTKKTLELRTMWNDPSIRDKHSESIKKNWSVPEYQQLISDRRKETWQDPQYRELKSEQARGWWQDEEYRNRQSQSRKETWQDSERKQITSERSKRYWQDADYRESVISKISGKNNFGYDHTIYHFVHNNGTVEHCTRHDLYTKYNLDRDKITLIVKGRRKSHAGWRLINTG